MGPDASGGAPGRDAECEQLRAQLRGMHGEMFARLRYAYQTIGAMLELMGEGGGPVPAAEVSRVAGRLQVLALVHAMLMRDPQPPYRLRLGALADGLGATLTARAGRSVRITLSGRDLGLGLRQVSSLALVLSELAGAARPGSGEPASVALSVEEGEVLIEAWLGEGPEAAALADPEDWGRQLIDTLARTDLGGGTAEWAPVPGGGLRARLRLPRAGVETAAED